jgi:hypothetical protein
MWPQRQFCRRTEADAIEPAYTYLADTQRYPSRSPFKVDSKAHAPRSYPTGPRDPERTLAGGKAIAAVSVMHGENY